MAKKTNVKNKSAKPAPKAAQKPKAKLTAKASKSKPATAAKAGTAKAPAKPAPKAATTMKSVATSAKQALMNAVSGKTSIGAKAKPGKAPAKPAAKPAAKATAKPTAKQNSKNVKAPQEDSNVGRMLSGVKKKLAALPSLVGGTTDTSSVPKGAKVSITEIARDMKARAESTRTKAPSAKAAFAAGNKGPAEGTKTRAANNTTGKGGHKALDQAGGRHH